MADLKNIWDQVKGGAISVWEGIRQYGQDFKQGVEEKGFFQWGIVEPLLNALALFGEGIDKSVRGLMPNVFKQADELAAKNPVETVGDAALKTIEKLAKSAGLSDEAIQHLLSDMAPIEDAHKWVQVAVSVFNFLATIGIFKDLTRSIVARELNAKYRPGVPSAGDVMGARGLDPKLDARIWEVLEQNGLREEDIELMFAATYQRIPLELLRTIYYRNGEDDNWLEHRLNEMGFTPERVDELKIAFPFLPTIQDLTYFMAREAFEPDMIKRYGLDELYPGELSTWAKKQGMDEEWAKRYWFAHWDHPGLQTVLEMYHRDQLSEDEMWNYFGLVEIPPFWRQKIMNISYNVITRVDARRMYQLGVVDEDQLHTMYRHMGYSPENADLMVDWTKHYAASQDRDLTRSDITKAYIDRDLTGPEAVDLLRKTGYPEDYANFIIYRTEMEMQRSAREEKLNLVKDQFVSNLINDAEARNSIIGLGFKTERANELMDKWVFLRWKNTKIPSKTDLDKLYRAAVITQAQYVDTMKKLGYADQYIQWYLTYIEGSAEE